MIVQRCVVYHMTYRPSAMLSQIAAEIRKIPLVTRFLCASSLIVTLPVLLKLVPLYKTFYIQQAIIRRFEVYMRTLLPLRTEALIYICLCSVMETPDDVLLWRSDSGSNQRCFAHSEMSIRPGSGLQYVFALFML